MTSYSSARPPRRLRRSLKRALTVLAAAALVLIAAWFILEKLRSDSREPPLPTTAAIRAAGSIQRAAPAAPEIEPIPAGTTLSEFLVERGFSEDEAVRFYREVRPVFDLRTIIAGRSLRFYRDAAGVVQAVEYDLDERRYLRVDREGMRFLPGIISYRFENRTAFIAGEIEDILINAIVKGGEKEMLALSMAELFAWDIDFNTELRVGDTFRMIFEKKFREGEFSGYGEILAAEFFCQGRRAEAFRFVYPDTGQADHFEASGKSVRKEFLRSPLPFAPVTSRFSRSRLHPIYKVYRAHYGVDFGAPLGTPVRATGGGVVRSTGWSGGAGQMVRIQHANGYETMYLHLSRILVRPGERVAMGQMIAKVGSTGASTGPHLDYRVLKNGGYLNPLSKRFDPVAPLKPQYKEAFDIRVAELRALLDLPFSILFR